MRIFPKNETYKKEPLAKTVAGPIFILLWCLLNFVLWGPLTSAQGAHFYGLSKQVTMRVESTEYMSPSNARYSAGWDCPSIRYFGSYESRKLEARACTDFTVNGKYIYDGDTVSVIIPPYGSDAYLAERGNPTPLTFKIFYTLFSMLPILYGIPYSLRMLYIGYSSNWKWSKKSRRKN